MRKSLFTLFIVLFLYNLSFSQIKEGRIIYDISYPESKGDTALMMMLPRESTVYFNADNLRMDMLMGQGLSNRLFIDNKSGDMHFLAETPGSKTDFVITSKDKKSKVKEENTVEYTDVTKDIAGLKCKKAIVKTASGQIYNVWLTNEILVNNAAWNEDLSGVKGFMMEFAMSQGSINMIMSARSVYSEKVAESLFIVPEGYQKITSEDLKKFSGGK